MQRKPVLKTYKLFINGAFPRSESGHFYPVRHPKMGLLANAALASRKDLRDAVAAARRAFPGWSGKTAYNRGQILYRVAEMVEARKQEFVDQIVSLTGVTRGAGLREVVSSVDRLIWYAGWADKYQQIFGSSNPVAMPYFNFTMPEPTGVVGVIAAEGLSLLPLVSQVSSTIVSGNTAVVLASEKYPLTAITFAEALATSDVPGGVVNILTGNKNDLIPWLAGHMDVNAIQSADITGEQFKEMQLSGTENVKRIVAPKPISTAAWFTDAAQSPYWISELTEYKTTWHPVGV